MPDVVFDVVTGRSTGLDDLPHIRIHKGLGDAALADLYRRADVLFLPLLESTANNALLEGIASGLPVVATDLTSVRAYLSNAGTILVRPGDYQAFIAALVRLRNSPRERAGLGRLARARAEQLAWPNVIPDYERAYRKAWNRGSAHLDLARPRSEAA